MLARDCKDGSCQRWLDDYSCSSCIEVWRAGCLYRFGCGSPDCGGESGRKIAVEVKSFLGKSGITELEKAIGQYVLYRSLLRWEEADRSLFLALPEEAYNAVLDSVSGEELISGEAIKLVLFDVVEEA